MVSKQSIMKRGPAFAAALNSGCFASLAVLSWGLDGIARRGIDGHPASSSDKSSIAGALFDQQLRVFGGAICDVGIGELLQDGIDGLRGLGGGDDGGDDRGDHELAVAETPPSIFLTARVAPESPECLPGCRVKFPDESEDDI